MKIHQASKIIEDLFEQSEKKSEIKTYQKLLGVLTHLNDRELTEEQLRSIEEKIDELKLTEHSQTRPKDLKRSSNEFLKFLRDKLSLIPEGYYTALGMCFGVAFGVSLGTFIQSLSEISSGAGAGIGMIIGMLIGIYLDNEAETQNRVLLSSLNPLRRKTQ